MGDPNETVTQTLDLLEAYFKDFKRELPRSQRPAYQELLRMAHRAMAPMNRRSDGDYQRVAMMAMLVGILTRLMRVEAENSKLHIQLGAVTRALEEAGVEVPALRGERPTGPELDALGQGRLSNYPPPGAVPA